MKTLGLNILLWGLLCSVVNAQATGTQPAASPSEPPPAIPKVEEAQAAPGAAQTAPSQPAGPALAPAEGTAERQPTGAAAADPPAVASEAPAATTSAAEQGPTPAASADVGAEPAAPEAQSGDAEESYELSEAELAELGFATDEAGEAAVDTSLRIYGFMDAGFQAALDTFGKRVAGRKANLYVGNLNLYLSKPISDNVRTMMEVRFLLLPNGAPDGTDGRTAALAPDYQDFNRPLRWGGVEVERVYLEWAIHELLSVRGGIFLTPYGVWNVDHGTPTIIPARRPFAIGNGYFPERQTGLEFFGNYGLSADETLGYHLTVSNGPGPTSEYLDLDGNKAVGGRVFLETRRLGSLKVGGSAFYGTYTDANFGPLIPGEEIVTQYDDLAFAADLSFRLEAFVLQAELVHRQRVYDDGARPAVANMGPPAIPANTYGWASYGLVGYRLPWLQIMPFFMAQTTSGFGTSHNTAHSLQPGLNIRALPELVLKVEYNYVFGDTQVEILVGQVAWAF